ncbi:MAG: type VI secretion system protein ImpM [Paraglaciecola sp.]|jgi:type VI secretion system protein ImpM
MTPGFYGKIPAKGDFIQRRLDRSFTSGWDNWLQSGMDSSRAALGESWLGHYMISPLWRFALSPGILSPGALVGVIMPSVDSVGRHFPLTLAVELADMGDLYQLAMENDSWFEKLEDIALSSLDSDFSLDSFEEQLQAHTFISKVTPSLPLPQAEGRMGWTHSGACCKTLLTAGMTAQLKAHSAVSFQCPSYWWTGGSDNIPASFLSYEGLPPPVDYASFISGDW